MEAEAIDSTVLYFGRFGINGSDDCSFRVTRSAEIASGINASLVGRILGGWVVSTLAV